MLSSQNDVETPYSSVPVDGKCVPAEYQFLPEAHGIYWNDDFFDDDEDIVAVFDFDYDRMMSFQTSITVVFRFIMVVLVAQSIWLYLGAYGAMVLAVVCLLSWYPCFFQKQVQWEVMANHVAITRDGIRFVRDRRKSCWGFAMCDKEKHIKSIMFDKIADCNVVKPVGYLFLCIKQVLHVVTVDTSAPGWKGNRRELCITGLKEPHKFQAMVMAMKGAPSRIYQAPP